MSNTSLTANEFPVQYCGVYRFLLSGIIGKSGFAYKGFGAMHYRVQFDACLRFLENKNISVIRRFAHHSRHILSLREAGFIKSLQGGIAPEEVLSVLSFNEQQALTGMTLSDADIKHWMGQEVIF